MTSIIPRVIYDSDSGYDDAWALFILLKAHSLNLIQLLAITCGTGNTFVDNCVVNVCRVLEVAQQKSIPVYRGAPQPFNFIDRIPDNYSGYDGFGDIFAPTDLPDMSPYNREEHGVTAMARIIKENPGEITLIAVGALTNIGLALRMYPDVMKLILSLFIMGGNFLGIGNMTPSAEFNAYCDPEAADAVLRGITQPITIVPWELNISPINTVTLGWRRKVLGARKHPILTLLNPIENSIFKSNADSEIWACADCVAAMCFLAPDQMIKKSENVYTAIELHGQLTRAQYVVDRTGTEPNSKMITDIDIQNFKRSFFWVTSDDVKISLKEYLKRGVLQTEPAIPRPSSKLYTRTVQKIAV